MARFICVDPSQCWLFISSDSDCFSSSHYGREEGEDIHEGKFMSLFWTDTGGQRDLWEFASSQLPSAEYNPYSKWQIWEWHILICFRSQVHSPCIVYYTLWQFYQRTLPTLGAAIFWISVLPLLRSDPVLPFVHV